VQSNHSVKVQTLNSAVEDTKVDVLLDTKDGEGVVMLKYSTWTEGLGWCCQKTIKLERDLIDDLHHALTVARMKINRQKVDAGKEIGTAKVVYLPNVA